jgi:hypothetical protein
MLASGGNPLGITIEGFSAADAPVTVVGVASDVITNVTVLEPLIIYLPMDQGAPSPHRDIMVLAASAIDARRDILSAVRSLDPQVAPTALRTLEERVADQMAPQQLGGTVLAALGSIAALLTLVGTYVLADSMATARMREMGIRAALGAQRRQLAAIVLGETSRLVGVGIDDQRIPFPGTAARSADARHRRRWHARAGAPRQPARRRSRRACGSRAGAARRVGTSGEHGSRQ